MTHEGTGEWQAGYRAAIEDTLGEVQQLCNQKQIAEHLRRVLANLDNLLNKKTS